MNTCESLSSEDCAECVAIHIIVLALISEGGSPYPLWAFPGEPEVLASYLSDMTLPEALLSFLLPLLSGEVTFLVGDLGSAWPGFSGLGLSGSLAHRGQLCSANFVGYVHALFVVEEGYLHGLLDPCDRAKVPGPEFSS